MSETTQRSGGGEENPLEELFEKYPDDVVFAATEGVPLPGSTLEDGRVVTMESFSRRVEGRIQNAAKRLQENE
jgi:hypothetical protein